MPKTLANQRGVLGSGSKGFLVCLPFQNGAACTQPAQVSPIPSLLLNPVSVCAPSTSMRQRDYAVGALRRRVRRLRKAAYHTLLLDADVEITVLYSRRWRRAAIDQRKFLTRRREIRHTSFNFNIFSTEESLRLFRFRPHELGAVAGVAGFNGRTTNRRYRCDGITAACIVLRRLASPCRWFDLERLFGMTTHALSEVFWQVLFDCKDKHDVLSGALRSDLLARRARMYADCIGENGAPLPNCVGFIDGTKIFIARPGGSGLNQRACYSGHKRAHCLVYLTVSTPDGLVLYLYGPEVGRRHDMTLYRQSGVDDQLRETLLIDAQQFYIYGDPAFVLRPWMQVGFNRAFATPAQHTFNAAMSSAREAVEWSYKDTKQQFTTMDFRRMLMVRKAPVALMYKMSILLWNVKVCLHGGGQVGTYFKCVPPTLREYLAPLQADN